MIDARSWVELFGVTLAGSHRPDSGLIWSEVEGWSGLTDGRGEGDAIPGAHGSFPRSRVWRESRQITLKGAIYADDNAGLIAARERLEAALFAGVGTMTVATPAGGSWSREVEIDTLEIDDDHGRHMTRFVVDMIAPDPRRYGPLMTVGPVGLPTSTGGVRLPQRFPWNFGSTTEAARLFVENAGLVDLSPAFAIAGGFSRVTVRDITTGARMRLDREVHEGETLVFDARSRRATIGASEVTRWMTARQWPVIGPGNTHEYRFEVDGRVGDPMMTAQFRIGAP